jgi:hypothetical protein
MVGTVPILTANPLPEDAHSNRWVLLNDVAPPALLPDDSGSQSFFPFGSTAILKVGLPPAEKEPKY